ncbi:MAG: hypothetical protein EAZ27_09655 [Cytophagales bacterium]|nr:MAG: hypothetical protein EAZ27_09655 [Cytophagales bacterium]
MTYILNNKINQLKHQNLFILIIILIVASFLRLYKLSFQSLWLDELFTAADCLPTNALSHLWFRFTHDQHPIFYYFLEWIWLKILGLGDVRVRIPSVIYGILGVYAIYLAGKKIFNEHIGLIAAALLAVNPFHIEYSQEARPYTLLFLLSTLSFMFFYQIVFLKENKLKQAIFYIISTILMLYTHYFGIMMMIAQALITIIYYLFVEHKVFELFKEKSFKTITICASIITLLFSPLIPVIVQLSK